MTKKAVHLVERLQRGGSENVALNYSRILSRCGVDSVMVGRHVSDEYESVLASHGVGTVERPSRRLLRDADYVFVHSNQNLLRLLPYYGMLKRRGARIIYTQHLNYSERKFRLLSRLINFFCTDFNRITPDTRELVERYIRIPVHFIVNFYINRYDVAERAAVREEVRRELGVADDKRVVMFSAVLKPGKGLADFLKLAKMFADDSRFVFLVVGDGPERGLVDEYVGGNIIRTGFSDNVERYLTASDVYCFPSQQEVMPMALIEAVNCDKPVLAYGLPANRFLLRGEVCRDLDEMRRRLDSGDIPSGFRHYDADYAMTQLRNIL